jgi:hypothetical protein
MGKMESLKPDHIKPCPICGRDHSHLGARGKNKVCAECETRAVDSEGRPVTFDEHFERQGDVIIMGGLRVTYREPDPQAGEINQEVEASRIVWVDGVRCRVYEGVAGWIGLVKAEQIIEF